MSSISVARVYEAPGDQDGYRALVDRLWPRGVRKAALDFDEWCKDVAPSTELRRWFGHDADRFDEFRRRYVDELRASDEPRALLERAGRRNLTLLIAAKDVEHDHGVILRDYLLELRRA